MWTGVCPGPGDGRHLRGIQSRRPISMARQLRLVDGDAELAQLRLVNRGRRPGEEVEARRGLGKGDHVADRLRSAEALDDAVDAVGDAAVRRGAVAKRLQKEAEAGLGGLAVDAEGGEDLRLHLGVVDADRATAQLLPVP